MAHGRGIVVRFLEGARHFLFLSVQAGSEAQAALYPVGTGVKAATTYLLQVLRLRICVAIPPLPTCPNGMVLMSYLRH
jgi:hypothetical protein